MSAYSYHNSHRISSSYQGTFGRPRQQQSSYEYHSYHQVAVPPAGQQSYGQDQPSSYEHQMYRRQDTSSQGGRSSHQGQASYVQQLYRGNDEGANGQQQMYSHYEASHRQQSSRRQQASSYVHHTTYLSQSCSGYQYGRDVFESETQASHTQQRSGTVRGSRDTPTREEIARSLGLPARAAYRPGTVREYPLPAADYDDDVEEIEYEDYPSGDSSPLGRGSVVSDRDSAEEWEASAPNQRSAYNAGQGVRSRDRSRRRSSRSDSTSQAVVKYDNRDEQGVNASRAASHDEDSGDDDTAVVRYEKPKPKSALSSKAASTPRKNPFDDEKSRRRPGLSGRSTAKPANNGYRTPARNDAQDSERAMKQKNERLAREKEIHNDRRDDAEQRRYTEDARRRMGQHTGDPRERQSSGVAANTGRRREHNFESTNRGTEQTANTGRGREHNFESTNRDTEHINGPKKVRFAGDSERSPRYSGDYMMSGALPSRLEELSLNDRDNSHSSRRTGLSSSRGTESRAARTNHTTTAGSVPSAQASRRYYEADDRDIAGDGAGSSRAGDMPADSRSTRAGRRADGGAKSMPRNSYRFD